MVIAIQPCACCENEIPAGRQEALPETMVCIECSRVMGGEYIIYVTPERTSKEGSLKKNYGGCGIRKVRKPLMWIGRTNRVRNRV